MTFTSEQAITKTFRLSRRLTVEMTVGPAGFACEWSPDVPSSLSRKEERRYVAARNEMLAKLAEMLGGDVAVVDLEEDGSLSEPRLIEKK